MIHLYHTVNHTVRYSMSNSIGNSYKIAGRGNLAHHLPRLTIYVSIDAYIYGPDCFILN